MPKLIMPVGGRTTTVGAKWCGGLIVIFFVLAGCRLLADDPAIQAAKEAFENLAKTGKFLKNCPAYAELEPRGCNEAAKAGDGTRCPANRRAEGGDVVDCKANIFKELMGSLTNADLKAKIEASSIHTAQMYAKITPKESVRHDHSMVFDTSATCDSSYVDRIDFINFRFALFDETKVKLSIDSVNYGGFQAEVKDSEGAEFTFDDRICGYRNHPDPRTCGPAKAATGVIVMPPEEGKTQSLPPKTPPPKEKAENAPPAVGPGTTAPSTPTLAPPPPAPATDRSQTDLAGKPQIFVAGNVSSEDEMLVTVRGTSTLEGMVVSAEANGKKTEARTNSKGQAVLSLAAIAGGATAITVGAIRALDADGRELAQAQTRITPGVSPVAAPPRVPSLPGLLHNGDVVTIPGQSLGAQCRLVVGNRAQETLSASSKELTSFVDAPAVGPQVAYVENANGASPSQTVQCYNFSVKAPQTTIVRGQHIVAVAQYEGLPPGSQIEFTNATPAIVKMKVRGASQTRGEQSVFTVSQPAGACEVELVGKGKGAFVINYKVLPPAHPQTGGAE